MAIQHERVKEARASVPMNGDLKAAIEQMAAEQDRSVAWVIREIIWAYMTVTQKVKVA